MPTPDHRNRRNFWLSGSGAALIAGIFFALTHPTHCAGGDGKTEKQADTSTSNTAQTQKLSGQDLYTINCSRCHTERYPREWTPGQWKTLMMHMRVRANIPADQAREILKYMQEESGN